MHRYICTVEFRDAETGTVEHFTPELEAPDADAAAEGAERQFVETRTGGAGTPEILEIVCRRPEEH